LLQRLALCLKIATLFQLAAVVCFALCHRYVDAGIEILGALFGIACIGMNAADEGFSLQTVLCYVAFAFVMLFWVTVRAVFFFIGKEAPAVTALTGWQMTLYQTTIVADVAVYFAITMLAYMLYTVRFRSSVISCVYASVVRPLPFASTLHVPSPFPSPSLFHPAQELRRIVDDVANLARLLTNPDALAAYAALPPQQDDSEVRDANAAAAVATAAGPAPTGGAQSKALHYSGESYKLKV
jgi:hypothetical protein